MVVVVSVLAVEWTVVERRPAGSDLAVEVSVATAVPITGSEPTAVAVAPSVAAATAFAEPLAVLVAVVPAI